MTIPKPLWTPAIVEDVNDIAERMKAYSNRSRAFVVYSFGTTVFSDSPRLRDDETTHRTLGAVVGQAPDFRVMTMEDGNFMVRFAGPVCGLVLAGFYEAHERAIRTNAASGGLLPGEVLLTPRNLTIPESLYYAGIYARAKLYGDVDTMQIRSRFTPTGSSAS